MVIQLTGLRGFNINLEILNVPERTEVIHLMKKLIIWKKKLKNLNQRLVTVLKLRFFFEYFFKVEDIEVGENLFHYTLSSSYYPNDLGGHYMDFNTKGHGGVNLIDGKFICLKG